MDTWTKYKPSETALHYPFYDLKFEDGSVFVNIAKELISDFNIKVTHIRRSAMSAVEMEQARCDRIVCEEWNDAVKDDRSPSDMIARILNRIRNVD